MDFNQAVKDNDVPAADLSWHKIAIAYIRKAFQIVDIQIPVEKADRQKRGDPPLFEERLVSPVLTAKATPLGAPNYKVQQISNLLARTKEMYIQVQFLEIEKSIPSKTYTENYMIRSKTANSLWRKIKRAMGALLIGAMTTVTIDTEQVWPTLTQLDVVHLDVEYKLKKATERLFDGRAKTWR